MQINSNKNYSETSSLLNLTSNSETLISSASYVRLRTKAKINANVTIREAATDLTYSIRGNEWSPLLVASSGLYCTKDSKEESVVIELIEYSLDSVSPGTALTSDSLAQFAATSSAQLASVLSNETGTGLVVFNNGPTLIAPVLGTPASGNLANCTFPSIVAPATHAATGKNSPIDADELAIVDTEASNALKKVTIAELKAVLKTYFDTLYAPHG